MKYYKCTDKLRILKESFKRLSSYKPTYSKVVKESFNKEEFDNLLNLVISGQRENIELAYSMVEHSNDIELQKKFENVIEKMFLGNKIDSTKKEDVIKFFEATLLDLNERSLNEIPKVVFGVKNLAWLMLNKNNLSSLPLEITTLNKLIVLECRNNKFTDFPKELLSMHQIQELVFSDNAISELPESIGKLTELDVLNFKNNRIKSIPKSFGNLIELDEVYLDWNEISEIPESIGNLSKLKRLSLAQNNLTDLPDSVKNLTNLEVFFLYGNDIPKERIIEFKRELPTTNIVF